MSGATDTSHSAAPVPRFVLFPEHVADLLAIKQGTARRWLASGRIGRTIQVGKRRAILLSELQHTLQARMDDGEDGEV